MEPLHRTAMFLLPFLLFLSFIAPFCRAAEPEVAYTSFHNRPSQLFFFDDQTNLLYHDAGEGSVYVSDNEGKSFERAKDIPMGVAMMLIRHSFDNSYAFVLTSDTTHYRTSDRGKTWQSFKTPVAPSYVPAPLSFHSDPKNYGMIIFQGTKCERALPWGQNCHDETYYTTDAFSSEPKLLLSETSKCLFAHGSKDFKHDANEKLIFCIAFDAKSQNGVHSLASSRLFASEDFFKDDVRVLDLGIGKNARGVVALAIVSKYAVVALKDLNGPDMLLYVSLDARTWARAQFPLSSSAQLRESAYTIVESTIHALAVDVMLHAQATVGTLFVSNSNGTFFVESLKDTNRNELGFVDYENLYGVEGVGLSNIVKNAREVEGLGQDKLLQTRITFDDGSSWSPLKPPSEDTDGKSIDCSFPGCSLHLHSVTTSPNIGRVFSSPAPGYVMGVGSVGDHLLPYAECDTFLSTDNGVTWKMIQKDAHKYEFGDSGSVLVLVNDEDGVDTVKYSMDLGKTWNQVKIPVQLRALALTTVPDSTSQKFVLLGQIARKDQSGDGRFAVVYLDFAPVRTEQCTDDDFEVWFARAHDHECVMGHKQWYKRRKADRNCYVGQKFLDPIENEENCPCTDADYECDYNFIRSGEKCEPAGLEPVPSDVCSGGQTTYMGSSGYRLIAGNTCDRTKGVKKDEPVKKDCAQAQPDEGSVTHQRFDFQAELAQQAYFKDSSTILVRLRDNTVWQSSNEGYTWQQIQPGETIVAFYLHNTANDRAYLITDSTRVFYTIDRGASWRSFEAPNPPNTFGAQILRFHPNSDYLIWTGNHDCDGGFCRAEAHYSTNNGGSWSLVDKYIRNCDWARDQQLKVDSTEILCESYKEKKGNQRYFGPDNHMELVVGTQFFQKNKRKMFDRVVGFAKFSEYLIVAEFQEARQSLDLQVSMDGKNFATGVFPPQLRPENHAYTILESSTKSVFMHLTTSEKPYPFWGDILKSNGNGTYFGLSVENVNRNDQGYVDFEKMSALDGIALINIVANPDDARLTGKKALQTRITHNDGGTWKPLVPPKKDSHGNAYECTSTKCALHIHGYTERFDSRATFSTPSVPGLIMAVGNVGETLAPYTESDTFFSRDGGFTWEEVHKDAHLWEFGDSGSILVLVNDEEPTDHVMFSTNEGMDWRVYKFTDDAMRIREIVTVPSDTSRKFILLGHDPKSERKSVAIQVDFSSLTRKTCLLDTEDPGKDDFELWSPGENREETCLFGRQTFYHRRKRDRDCVVGNQPKAAEKIQQNCACIHTDFECEFNHIRNSEGNCVLVDGAAPLPSDDSCRNGDEYWYERTAYRKTSISTCEGGLTIDRGPRHLCPGLSGHGFFWWLFVLFVPISLAALVGYWAYKRHGRGAIRLPSSDHRSPYTNATDSGILATLASVPWFVIGIAGIAWEKLASMRIPFLQRGMGGMGASSGLRGGYRTVPIDEDAQVLRFEDEE